MYYLKTSHFKLQLERLITGSAQLNFGPSHIKQMRMPLPAIEEQHIIISILDKVNCLITERKQQLVNLDLLVKSQFVEMFGLPLYNVHGWDLATVRDVVTDVRYGTSKPAMDDGEYTYLRMNNITYEGQLDLSDIKRISVTEAELSKCIVKKGDVLFNRTNSRELVGKTCVFNLNEPMVIAGYIIRIRLNEHILPEYLSTAFNTTFYKKLLNSICKGAIGQANINAQELQDIEILVPPVGLQREFVSLLQAADKSKFELQRTLDELEATYKAFLRDKIG